MKYKISRQTPITANNISGATKFRKKLITIPKLPPLISGLAIKATYGAMSPILANSTKAKNKNKNISNGNALA